jgi:PII-like signaling protein
MELPRDALLLRIFIGEKDVYQGEPLFRAIVLKAREHHLAGATVFRGPMGFGKSSHLYTSGILRLSIDLPVVIEIVDTEEKIRIFLTEIQGILGGGLVTLERVQAIFYKGTSPRPHSKPPMD